MPTTLEKCEDLAGKFQERPGLIKDENKRKVLEN
jgi:hypothetical protein